MEYIVYVKTNKAGYITAVGSSGFLNNTADWTEIDRGSGQRFYHAQPFYLPDHILTESGVWRYKLVDGVPVECSAEEIAEQEAANAPDPVTPDAPGTGDASAVWDELDAAYTAGYNAGYEEGVNAAYVNE